MPIDWSKINEGLKGLSKKELIMIRDIIDFKISKTEDQLSEMVCLETVKYYNIALSDFFSKDRHKELVHARYMAMYILRKYKVTTTYIGHKLGNKNHATVVHGTKKMADLIEVYPAIKKEAQDLMAICENEIQENFKSLIVA